jgi:hypothetical protein
MPLILKFTLKAIIMGTVVTAFLAGMAYAALKKLPRAAENALPISCAIVVLILIGFSTYLLRRFDLNMILTTIVSGFLAFSLLRLLFKKEIEDDGIKDRDMTGPGNGPVIE